MQELTAPQSVCVEKMNKSDVSSPGLGARPPEGHPRVLSVMRIPEGPDEGGHVVAGGPVTSCLHRQDCPPPAPATGL